MKLQFAFNGNTIAYGFEERSRKRGGKIQKSSVQLNGSMGISMQKTCYSGTNWLPTNVIHKFVAFDCYRRVRGLVPIDGSSCANSLANYLL